MKNSSNISGRIIDIMNSQPKVTINGDEWVNLASLGIALKSFGIDYNLFGFEKLRGFIESFPELELYKDDEQVMHISGYMWPHKRRLPNTFFYEVPYPGGGWATWKRAWKYYTNDTKSLYDYWCTRWDEFNKFGDNYLQKQLEANYFGTMKTWFIKWHAVMLQRGALTLYPGQSLTNNIGFDDQATNCFATTQFDVVPVNQVSVTRQSIKENKRAAREIYAFYQGRWYNRRRRTRLLNEVLAFFHLPLIKI